MAKWNYVGDGVGVPGLPHELTDEEAAALGVEEILKAAVANGTYKVVPFSGVKATTKKPDAVVSSFQELKKKEVKHG